VFVLKYDPVETDAIISLRMDDGGEVEVILHAAGQKSDNPIKPHNRKSKCQMK
jgi:hypothetical protein